MGSAYKTECTRWGAVNYWEVDQGFTLSALNPSFENLLGGATPPTTFTQLDASLIEGWETNAPDNEIEIWASGFQGVPAYDGSYFVEMNSTFPARMGQFLSVPNALGILRWQVVHRARGGANTINIADVIIAKDGVDEVVQRMESDGSDWTVYSGEVIKECGIQQIEIAFDAIQGSGTPSVGNFLDDVRLEYFTYLEPCNVGFTNGCIDEDGDIIVYASIGDDTPLDKNLYTLCNPTCVFEKPVINGVNYNQVTGELVIDLDDTNILTTIIPTDEDQQLQEQYDANGNLIAINITDGDGNIVSTIDLSTLLDNQTLSATVGADGATNTISISEGNTIPVTHPPTLATTVYSETYSGYAQNTTLVYSRGSTTVRLGVGVWQVRFNSPHPDGLNYNPTLTIHEDGVNRDVAKISIIEGSQNANGFDVQITVDDNGNTADVLVDRHWSWGVSSPITFNTIQ